MLPHPLPYRTPWRLPGCLLAGLMLASAGADALTESGFADPEELLADGGTGGTAVADLDRDGSMEFVVQRQLLIVDLVDGEWRTHGPLADTATRLNRFAGDIAIGDVNGDLWPDIITTDSAFDDTVGSLVWFENPGGDLAGTWTEHLVDSWDGSGTGDEIVHAEEEAGDLDGDGRLDIVVRDISHGFWVFLQNPAGGWHPRRFTATNPREGLALWDPDGDGDLDVLLNGVWFETPADPVAGSWTQHAIIGMEGWYPDHAGGDAVKDYATKVLARDFDGDGRDDVLISNAEELNGGSPTKPHGIRLYLQPADPLTGTWTEAVLTPDHFSWHTLQAADINRDGRSDVLAAISPVGNDTAAPDLSLWINEGQASFAKVGIDNQLGYQGAIGDADGDGNPEILLPEDFDAGPVRVYRNEAGIDASGLYSAYRAGFGLAPAVSASSDADGDRLGDLVEFVLATDPTAATPAPQRPAVSIGPSGPVFHFRRDARVGAGEIAIETSDDLATFTPAVDGTDGVGILFDSNFHGPGIDRVSVLLPAGPAGDSRRFARIRLAAGDFIGAPSFAAVMQASASPADQRLAHHDPDNDGIVNELEFAMATDPARANGPEEHPFTIVDGGTIRFVFRHHSGLATGRTWAESSSDLVTFTRAVDGVDGTTITRIADGFAPGVDRVEVAFPLSRFAGQPLFLRVATDAATVHP